MEDSDFILFLEGDSRYDRGDDGLIQPDYVGSELDPAFSPELVLSFLSDSPVPAPLLAKSNVLLVKIEAAPLNTHKLLEKDVSLPSLIDPLDEIVTSTGKLKQINKQIKSKLKEMDNAHFTKSEINKSYKKKKQSNNLKDHLGGLIRLVVSQQKSIIDLNSIGASTDEDKEIVCPPPSKKSKLGTLKKPIAQCTRKETVAHYISMTADPIQVRDSFLLLLCYVSPSPQ